MKEIVFISCIRWDYAWHRQQELMKKLSEKGFKILFVQPSSLIRQKELKSIDHNIWILTPRGLPYERCLYTINSLNTIISRIDIQMSINLLRFQKPIIWLDRIHGIDYKYYCKNYYVIYDLVDEILAFGRYRNKRLLIGIENYVLKNANLVTSSSRTLLERKLKQSGRIGDSIFIPNGVDSKRFRTNNQWERCITINHPIIGFVGTISKRSIDYSIVLDAADNLSECEFVFVGPGSKEDKALLNRKNIHVFDAVNGDLIPEIINTFDIAIIPYINNNMSMDYVFPRKACEYLAAGKPVITTDMKELRYLQPYVKIARNAKEFISLIKQSLNNDQQEILNRYSFSRQFDWDELLNIVISKIK